MANKEAILNLRVFIPSTNSTRTLRFAADMPVGQMLKEIADRIGMEGRADHGLFSPPNKETMKKGFWLDRKRTLRFYGIASNVSFIVVAFCASFPFFFFCFPDVGRAARRLLCAD
jgi:hypothetical protein